MIYTGFIRWERAKFSFYDVHTWEKYISTVFNFPSECQGIALEFLARAIADAACFLRYERPREGINRVRR